MEYGFKAPSGHHVMIEDLKAALEFARDGDVQHEELMTERIRDASYDVMPRQAGYLVRSACGAIDAVMRSFDREQSLAFAEHEIEKVQDMLWRAESQASAA